MQHTLKDFGLEMSGHLSIMIVQVQLVLHPMLHSRTKHVEVKYHFIIEYVQERDIDIQYVSTDQQLGDVFPKPLGEERYMKLRNDLGIVANHLK